MLPHNSVILVVDADRVLEHDHGRILVAEIARQVVVRTQAVAAGRGVNRCCVYATFATRSRLIECQ